jgi:hypothetical protein
MYEIMIIYHGQLLLNKQIMNEQIIRNHVLILLNEQDVELNSNFQIFLFYLIKMKFYF